jgi:hypothetical protein
LFDNFLIQISSTQKSGFFPGVDLKERVKKSRNYIPPKGETGSKGEKMGQGEGREREEVATALRNTCKL